MADNFRITVHRNSDNLHLKLVGDFDGNSASELMDLMRRSCPGTSRIFIHTSCVNDIHPFARSEFKSHLDLLNSHSISVVFTGENAFKLSHEEACTS